MQETIRFAAIATLAMFVATAGPVAAQSTTQRMQPPPTQLPAPRSGQPVDAGPQKPPMTVMFKGPAVGMTDFCLGVQPRLVNTMPPKQVLERGNPLHLAPCGQPGTRWAVEGKGFGTVRVADHVPPLCLSVVDPKGPLVVADCVSSLDKGSTAQAWAFQSPTKDTVQLVSKLGCVAVKTPPGAMQGPQVMLGGCNEKLATWTITK